VRRNAAACRSSSALDGMKKALLALLAVCVVAPTAVAVLVATMLSPLSLLLPRGGGDIEPFAFVMLTLVGGWFGVAALVRLCSHYAHHDQLPPAPRKSAAGLLCGTASALTLIASAGRPFQFPAVLLFGPVVAAAILGYLLWMSWPANLQETEPGPLRRLLGPHAERLQLVSLSVIVAMGLVALVFT
jgi:hypothetical protein